MAFSQHTKKASWAVYGREEGRLALAPEKEDRYKPEYSAEILKRCQGPQGQWGPGHHNQIW